MAVKTTSGGGFILVVEDDRGTSELEAQRLEPLGFAIIQAAGAEEAVGILKQKTPVLMLLDYSLPGLNALELLDRLRENSITIPPFFVATGRGDETLPGNIMQAGALGYIIKDSEFFQNLLPVIMKALEKAGLITNSDSAQKSTAKGRGPL